MPTVITDKTDLKSIEEILDQFKEQDQVDIYSSEMSPIERAIVVNNLSITSLIVQKEAEQLIFILSNGTIIQRKLAEIEGLTNASIESLTDFENMGNGIIWNQIPAADISLKVLIQEELQQKFSLDIA
uniref:hypothetical protein n=1 Tax=Roseivirga sp. TaxID=1964215 RepID=UPI004048D7A4